MNDFEKPLSPKTCENSAINRQMLASLADFLLTFEG